MIVGHLALLMHSYIDFIYIIFNIAVMIPMPISLCICPVISFRSVPQIGSQKIPTFMHLNLLSVHPNKAQMHLYLLSLLDTY